MPKVIIINIPMMYHCVLHIQSISLMSVASTPLMCCIAMFVTKAFNFDCLYIIYIITNVMIMVTCTAVNRSMSARKLLRNDLNSEFSFVLSNPWSFLSKIFLLFWYCLANSHKVFGALSKLGLISKVSIDRGKICSWVVQFPETGIPSSSIMSLK